MKSDLAYIAAVLKGKCTKCHIADADTAQLDTSRIFGLKESRDVKNRLCYLSNLADLPPDLPSDGANYVFCAMAPEEIPPQLESYNYIAVATFVYTSQVSEIAEAVIKQRKRFYAISQELTKALYYGNGMDAIVGYGRQLIDAPLSIGDSSFSVLANNVDEELNMFTKETGRDGFVSDEAIQHMHSYKRISRAMVSATAVFTPNDQARIPMPEYGWLDIAIRVHGVVTGHMTAYGVSHPFSQFDMDCMRYLAMLVSMEMQKTEHMVSGEELRIAMFFSDILGSKITNETLIRRRLQNLNIHLQPYLFLVVVKSRTTRGMQASSSIDGLRKLLSASLAGEYDNEAVFLLCRSTQAPFLPDEQENIEKVLTASNLIAGISSCFSSLSLFTHHYQQAHKTVMQNMFFVNRPMIHYMDTAIYQMLSVCSKEIPLKDLCIPGIYELYEKDANDELLNTLDCYLSHSKKVHEITVDLHISKSTLFYRIGKLKDKMPTLDFDSVEDISRLHRSLAIIRYLKSENQASLQK